MNPDFSPDLKRLQARLRDPKRKLKAAKARLDRVVGQEVLRSRPNGEIRFGDVWLIATTKGGGPCTVPEEISEFIAHSTNDMWFLMERLEKLQKENEVLRKFTAETTGVDKLKSFRRSKKNQDAYFEGMVKGDLLPGGRKL